MQKIPTLFVRDWDGDRRYVLPEITPGCEWVINGEGTATREYDGTCVMFDGERWWARREVKEGETAPAVFVAPETDPETGKVTGWEPIGQSGFAKYHTEALDLLPVDWRLTWPNVCMTYELCGPKVNGNPEGFECHILIPHCYAQHLHNAPRTFEALAAWLHAHPYAGIVWHHPDGRMAKIKKRDFRKAE
jgi:hypothetical protein